MQSEITISSVNCTPMKSTNKDFISNNNLIVSQSHQKRSQLPRVSPVIAIAGKKNISLASANSKLEKKKKTQNVLSSGKTPLSNNSSAMKRQGTSPSKGDT